MVFTNEMTTTTIKGLEKRSDKNLRSISEILADHGEEFKQKNLKFPEQDVVNFRSIHNLSYKS